NAVRVHGASGKHLSEGERSLLSAFQEAAMKYADKEIGVLIPFSAFYDTIQGFLDANIISIITQSKKNSRLNEEDVVVLKLLFMIKYVKEIPGNVENLSTLLVNNVDDDKTEIKKKVLESLGRLLKENLIQENGEEYIFLTKEEQDISRKIKNISIDIGEVIQNIGEMIFEEIYTDKKYRYSAKYNFSFNAMVDDRARGSQNNEIGIRIITPYFDTEIELTHEELKLMSSRENKVIVKLPSNTSFLKEIEEMLKIQKYLRIKSGAVSSEIIEDIRIRKSREAIERKDRAKTLLLDGLKQADIFVNSSLLDIKEKNPIDRINDGFRVLVDNLYNKINYIKTFIDNSKYLNDILENTDPQWTLIENEPNKLALQEVNEYIERNTARNISMTMKSIITLYSKPPYGWTELDMIAMIIKLFKSQKIKLEYSNQDLMITDKEVVNYLTSRDYIDRIVVKKKINTLPKYISNVKKLCKELFNYSPLLSDEDELMNRFKELGKEEVERIRELLIQYDQANYPGKDVLLEGKT
ncbi:MAG: BREX system P-loop protein BrxC, partial [Peptostreptococcaceae bacterium]